MRLATSSPSSPPAARAGSVGWSLATHERNMGLAIVAARRAAVRGAAAIAAVLVDRECRLVATGESRVASDCDPTAHAEISALRQAGAKLGRSRFPDLVMYSTIEPCAMCVSACAWAGLDCLVFGAAVGTVSERYFERGAYSAVAFAEGSRRDPDDVALEVRGPLLGMEAASLLAG